MLLVLSAGPLAASADMVILSGTKDNTLFESTTGAESNGAGEFLFVGRSLQADARRTVLAFDVSAIPPGAHVESATLTLHMSRTIVGTVDIAAHRLQRDWGQGLSDATGREGAGAAAQAGDATWLHNFFNTSQWTTAGGDFDAVASASTPVGGLGFYDWSSPSLAADVQAWVLQPQTNFGWLLLADESKFPSAKRFDSIENRTAIFRPSLTISYTAVPEPASGLCLLALLLAAKRRGSR